MEYHFYFQLFLLNLKRIFNLFLFFSLLKSFLAKKGGWKPECPEENHPEIGCWKMAANTQFLPQSSEVWRKPHEDWILKRCGTLQPSAFQLATRQMVPSMSIQTMLESRRSGSRPGQSSDECFSQEDGSSDECLNKANVAKDGALKVGLLWSVEDWVVK